MATINLNEAIGWLKRMEEQSNINRQRFEARPSVPASQAWSGYRDKPGGQRLMVRQMQRPEIDNTLTVKNDGTQTLVKKWKDPDQSNVKATALPRDTSPITMQPIGPNYTGPWGTGERIPAHVPRMRGDIGATESIGVADPNPRARGMRPSLANLGTPNILQQFLQGRQRIADRIERNRINRLMQFRTSNPYYGSGGTY
tara:strand:- start:848 stop:1444 length:597 start_codon:yes stop_codon:yes gene_type:complete